MREQLAAQHVSIVFCDVAKEAAAVQLGYMPLTETGVDFQAELARIIRVVQRSVVSGLNAQRIVVAIVNPGDAETVVGTFTVETDWIEQYHADDLTKPELAQKIADTIERPFQ